MTDQFDELQSPEALREECRSLLAQLQATQRGCNNARIDELVNLYAMFEKASELMPNFGLSKDTDTLCKKSDLAKYIDKRKEELK